MSNSVEMQIDNYVQNEILHYSEYIETLSKQEKYLYFPPEFRVTLSNEDHSGQMGMWTVGVILYELLFGKKPFNYAFNMVDFEVKSY